MRYYKKFLLGGCAYIAVFSYILRDYPEQYYSKKIQEIESFRVNVYQTKVNILKVEELNLFIN